MIWTPITLEELNGKMQIEEKSINAEVFELWKRINIIPEKWMEETQGNEGNGFWVVGLIDKKIIWYNDIEDGFNISAYDTYGKIEEYQCEQDALNWALQKLYNLIK